MVHPCKTVPRQKLGGAGAALLQPVQPGTVPAQFVGTLPRTRLLLRTTVPPSLRMPPAPPTVASLLLTLVRISLTVPGLRLTIPPPLPAMLSLMLLSRTSNWPFALAIPPPEIRRCFR